jgi:hypothetical protein
MECSQDESYCSHIASGCSDLSSYRAHSQTWERGSVIDTFQAFAASLGASIVSGSSLSGTSDRVCFSWSAMCFPFLSLSCWGLLCATCS